MASAKSEGTIRGSPLPKERSENERKRLQLIPTPPWGHVRAKEKNALVTAPWVTASAQGVGSGGSGAQGSSQQQKGLLAKLLPVPLLITGLGLGKVFTSLVGSRSCVSSFWRRHFSAFGPPLC